VTVAKSGGQYKTIQDAVDSLSTTSSAAQCIFINPGTYSEQVLVSSRSAQLTIYGYTSDTSSYSSNQVTITASKSQADGLSNDQTGTLRIKANNFKLYNINVNNGHGAGSQAIALSAYADSGYYGCAFTGYQDTLLANQGTQLYSHCMIQGATDFIFGQHAPAWFEKCDIRVLARGSGGCITGKDMTIMSLILVSRLRYHFPYHSISYITHPYYSGRKMLSTLVLSRLTRVSAASGRSSSSDSNYYVFNGGSVAAASGNNVADGTYYLGRPWADYARVVFQRTSLSSVVNAAGWKEWSSSDDRTDHVTFEEYGNTGAGAQGTRASFSKKLSSAVDIESVLGSGVTSKQWYDADYM
jgi:pectinesterase